MRNTTIKKLFPQARYKAFTMSYDDGYTQDKRFLKILDKYDIKCTFNLNAGLLNHKTQNDNEWRTVINGKEVVRTRICDYEIKELYKNHEIAAHSFTHPHLENLSEEKVTYEVVEDRKGLEAIAGYPVRGMAYPFGTYNQLVLDVLERSGIEYCRTVKFHETFKLPEKYLELEATCHHNNPKLIELCREFINKSFEEASLFYVWGHTYEFDDHENWDMIEAFCEMISGHSDVWYATNMEIVDYLKACDQLEFSVEHTQVFNPTAFDIWIEVNGKIINIPGGQTVSII